jgi:hypothetical protein
MEEEEPTGYIQSEKFLKVASRLLAENKIVRDDEEALFRAFQV